MPTFNNLESLASVRAKINNAISNSETALTRLDNNDIEIDQLDVRVTDLEAGGGGGGTWGSITGTLSSQIDLQAALDAKATTSHSHIIADTTGLQAALDGKQPLSAVLTATTASFLLADETKLDGIAAGAEVNVPTDLTYTAATRVLASSTGTDATLPLFTSTDAGLTPLSGGGTTNYLRADGTWTAPPIGGVSDGDKGDITVSGSGATWTIDNGVVTLAKQADMATGSVVYRKTAGSGAPEVQTLATLKTDLGLTGTNSGDQTTIVGITGTKAQFDTAVTDGNFLYVGDAPTAHTHLLAAGATDVTITAANLNALDDGLNTTLHFHDADRARAVHTGTQLASTISDFTETAQDAVGAMVDASLTYVDGTPLLQRAALTGAVTASAGSNATSLGSFTKAQLDTAVSDGNVLYVGDVTSNATHTGDVTGSTALTIDPTAISGKTLVTAVGADSLLILDATDGLLKKALASDLIGGGGATNLSYTAATRIIASDTGTDATLPLVTSGDAGLAPASGGGTTNFLRADGTWTSPGASSGPPLGLVVAMNYTYPLF